MPILADRESWNSALQYMWGQYRKWAKTSRTLRAKVSGWRKTVLLLSISGATMGILCQQAGQWSLNADWSWLQALFGILSAVALGLAAYFTKEALSPDPEGRAVRARSAAEAFKSEAYLLAAQVPPYSTADTSQALYARTDKIKKAMENLVPVTITLDEELSSGIPSKPLSVEDYIKQRVDQQIYEYYIPEALKNEKKVAWGQTISLILGALAVVFGAVGAKFSFIAGWTAVISTITAAIAAYQYAGRYQFLIISYQATAERLEWLKTQWEISHKTDADQEERNKFILDCEEAISIENNAWMAEWTKKPSKQQP
jgi:hypothetical protein